jgi:hypothetical protein
VRYLRGFARFLYDFVVGDDWRLALGVGAALALTWPLATYTSVNPWWLPIAAIGLLLPVSLWRATRQQPLVLHRNDDET